MLSLALLICAGCVQAMKMKAVVAKDGRCEVVEKPIPEAASSGGSCQMLVKVAASALNRADTLQRRGKYPPPPGVTDTLGLELAGSLVDVPTCASDFSVGDRVMSLVAGGGYAEYALVEASLTIKVPASMTIVQAASIPEVWLTAFQILHLVGEVRPTDTVLVHAGGSGVGLAAVQLATSLGATVYVTAGTQAKIDTAKRLGAKGGFNYKGGNDFSQELLRAEPGGVDLVLDCVGSSHAPLNIASLKLDGRWVLYGLMGGAEPPPAFLSAILRKRIQLRGTTLRTRSLGYKAELVRRFKEHAIARLASGGFKAVVDRTFDSIGRAQAAHEYMEANKNTGKIVLRIAQYEEEQSHGNGKGNSEL